MRKIILAAAIATSALGLTACGGNAETETDETVQAMGEQAEEAAARVGVVDWCAFTGEIGEAKEAFRAGQ